MSFFWVMRHLNHLSACVKVKQWATTNNSLGSVLAVHEVLSEAVVNITLPSVLAHCGSRLCLLAVCIVVKTFGRCNLTRRCTRSLISSARLYTTKKNENMYFRKLQHCLTWLQSSGFCSDEAALKASRTFYQLYMEWERTDGRSCQGERTNRPQTAAGLTGQFLDVTFGFLCNYSKCVFVRLTQYSTHVWLYDSLGWGQYCILCSW